MVKEVELTQGYVALVDDEDYDRVSQHLWSVSFHKTANGITYVRAGRNKPTGSSPQRYSREYLPQFLMPGFANVVHLDGNTLNCQRANLRGISTTERNATRRKSPGKSSRFKGVHWHNSANRWVARIRNQGEEIYLGCFKDEVDAARAYDAVAFNLFGPLARLNFPLDGERGVA